MCASRHVHTSQCESAPHDDETLIRRDTIDRKQASASLLNHARPAAARLAKVAEGALRSLPRSSAFVT